ncbi:unnamed protein product [Porites evermanni]|uniref:C-terminal of Roc (COR) domain-containing protein n=1 Tax=Porites evermanni TaxID=104178 RepID=A0ABN8Q1C2_9CNID|nr:unnamed protein product [Porites evermanni]
MFPAIKNAGTGAWRNPASLEHTTVFDHKVAAKTAEDLLSKHSEQQAKKRPRIVASNKTDQTIQMVLKDENCVGRLQRRLGFPLMANESATLFSPRACSRVSLITQKIIFVPEDQDLGNQKKPFGVPDEIAIILEQHLDKNEADTDEKIWPIIWDFAGQDIYRAMHPIFMSSDDIYLLVFDLTKKLSEKAECRVNVGHRELTATALNGEDTNLDHLFRWMDLIHSLKKNFQSDGLSYPPVILVGTHADCVDDPRQAIESVVEEECSSVFDIDTYLPHIADCLPIDNTKSGKSTDQEEIIELRRKILELADTMPHTKKKIPLQWHRVEKEICQPVWQQEKYLLLESFREKMVSPYCTFEDEGDFDELVYFLHGRGTIVYHEYEHDKKKGLIVLNPQWLSHVLCEIIKVKPDDKEPWIIKDRKKLAEKGVLSVND